jgi:hypothetical protein
MSNKKQSSVEWFASVTAQLGYVSMEILEQAKAMHRKEIEDAYVECYMNHVGNGESILREANSYYKNTYGGSK